MVRSPFFAPIVLTALVLAACSSDAESEPLGEGADNLTCANARAARLSTAARSVEGRKSQHLCYAGVKKHLRAAGIPTASIESSGNGGSAFMFARWAARFPDQLRSMGFEKAAKVDLDELPRGAIIVWPRGMCGYNKVHGHIEIVATDRSNRACSDFCGGIKKGCGTPDVFVPSGCGAAPADASRSAEAPAESAVVAPAEEADVERSGGEPGETDAGANDDVGALP